MSGTILTMLFAASACALAASGIAAGLFFVNPAAPRKKKIRRGLLAAIPGLGAALLIAASALIGQPLRDEGDVAGQAAGGSDGVSAATPFGGRPLDDAYSPAIWPIREEDTSSVSFRADVLPILRAHCLKCHDDEKRRGGLSLAGVASILAGGEYAGPAVVAGAPDDSPLVLHVRGILRPKMPRNGPELSQEDLHTIRVWIAAGAKDPDEE